MAEDSRVPVCCVVAGPNGAGKTTFALRYLPEMTGISHFINADMIAAGLSPISPEQVQMRAGRLLLEEIRRCVEKRVDFAFETTLSGRSYARLLARLRHEGWKVSMFYLWIPSKEFSRLRVRQRVEEGGHDIPLEAIKRRYDRTLSNFLKIFAPICDDVVCFDNTQAQPILVFDERQGKRTIVDRERYDRIVGYEND